MYHLSKKFYCAIASRAILQKKQYSQTLVNYHLRIASIVYHFWSHSGIISQKWPLNKYVSLSVYCLLVCLSVCTHILQKKSMYQKNFGHPRMTLGWMNPELDFFTILLSPLKMQKEFQFFWIQVFLDILGASLAKKFGVPMS